MDAEKIISKTPEAILKSFIPAEKSIGFSMAQWLMLEEVESGVIIGTAPKIFDWVAMWLIKHNPERIEQEISSSRARAYIQEAIRKISPAELALIQLEMAPTLGATFAPLMTGATAKKKKSSSSDADGGSVSTTSSPMSTDGLIAKLCRPQSAAPSA